MIHKKSFSTQSAIFDKILVSKIYKELLQLNNTKITQYLKLQSI